VKVNWPAGGTYRHRFYGRRVSLARKKHEIGSKISTPKMEAVCSSETSADFHARSYIPVDRTLSN
jgi:hypothetical protein